MRESSIKADEREITPEASDAGPISRLPDAEWKRQHDETGKTIFWAMVSIVVFSLFCLATLATRDDAALLDSSKPLKLPLLDVEVLRTDFLVIGPILLAALSFYQQVFIGYQRSLGVPKEVRAMPYIFNLPYRSNRLLSGFLFYWLVPFVLFAFTFRTARISDVGSVQTFIFALVTAVLVGLQIRRYQPAQRSSFLRGLGYLLLCLIEGVLVFMIIAQIVRFPAPLLGTAKPSLDLSDARRREELRGADLRRTYLQGANLRGADFAGTTFLGATLQGANLQDTNLHDANLQNSNLQDANLQGANLQGANLRGADLRGALNLTQEQIKSAITDETTRLPSNIGLLPPKDALSPFEKRAGATVTRFIDAYNTFSKDPSPTNLTTLMSFWAKEAQLIYPTVTLKNREEIQARYTQIGEDKEWGDRRYVTARQLVQGSIVAWEGTWNATFKPLNKTVELPIVIMFELDQRAQIVRERHFYDEASLQRELQLPRPR